MISACFFGILLQRVVYAWIQRDFPFELLDHAFLQSVMDRCLLLYAFLLWLSISCGLRGDSVFVIPILSNYVAHSMNSFCRLLYNCFLSYAVAYSKSSFMLNSFLCSEPLVWIINAYPYLASNSRNFGAFSLRISWPLAISSIEFDFVFVYIILLTCVLRVCVLMCSTRHLILCT